MKALMTKIMYFIAHMILVFGIWLDERAYDITCFGIHMTYDLDKGRYKWQK